MRLQSLWNIENLKVILFSKGMYHLLLHSLVGQIIVMAQGVTYTKPCVLMISRWYPSFNPNNHIQTTTLVWVMLYDPPLEFRKEKTFFNIVRGMGMSLKIDPQTISLYHGIFSRVLVKVDCAHSRPNKILAQGKNKDKKVEEDFFCQGCFLKKFSTLC